MASMSYLSLIQILNVLHNQEQTEVISKTISQAKLFALKLLERDLEHLAPDARFLLLLLEKKAKSVCSLFRLNRKKLLQETGWNVERLKSSLDLLLDGKYLRKHQKKQSCVYELLYDSAKTRRIDYVMKPQGPSRKMA